LWPGPLTYRASVATRQETGKRKQALMRWLRNAIYSGNLRPGEMTPTARELCERFHLSLRVVALEMQEPVPCWKPPIYP